MPASRDRIARDGRLLFALLSVGGEIIGRLPTRIKKPRDKAKAEVAVQIVQRFVLARLRIPLHAITNFRA